MVRDFKKLTTICGRMLNTVRLADLAGFTTWGIGVIDDAPGYALDTQLFSWDGNPDTSGAFSCVFFTSGRFNSNKLTPLLIASALQNYAGLIEDGRTFPPKYI